MQKTFIIILLIAFVGKVSSQTLSAPQSVLSPNVATLGEYGNIPVSQYSGLFDIDIHCEGDLEIDDHHTVEDCGITLGQAFAQALGDKKGLKRYGHFYAPLDESLSRVVVDLSGRPGLFMDIPFTRAMIGRFDVDLFSEFFQGFVNHSLMTVHIDNLKGKNSHHQIESVFKAFARALRMACEVDPRAANTVASTKGTL